MTQAGSPSRGSIGKLRHWLPSWLVALGMAASSGTSANAADPRPLPRFERIVIDDQMPGGYQVEVADVNGDRKPDIVALGGGTCAWYENPTWKKRIVSNSKQTPGIISSATADIDGDGKAEIAIAYEFSMNVPTKGKLLLAHQGNQIDDPWIIKPIADVGSIHRLRWGMVTVKPRIGPASLVFDKTLGLVVAPIFGPSAKPPIFDQEPAHLLVFGLPLTPAQGGGGINGGSTTLVTPPGKAEAPNPRGGGLGGLGGGGAGGVILGGPQEEAGRPGLEINTTFVLHAIDVVDLDGDGLAEVLGASNAGITCVRLIAIHGTPIYRSEVLAPGAPGDAPKKGASEVHVGRLKDGRRFLATVEPWHGTDVAVYLSDSQKPLKFGSRNVIDTTLKEGHALWVADVDGDGDDEVFAGYRGPGNSVLGYDFDGKTWTRTVVDPDIAAQDLRGGDLDGDGTPDVVAIGGRTHNVVWYRPRKD